MRRSKQALDDSQIRSILEDGIWGTLSVVDDDGLPYGVPVNYVWFDDRVYFHCATAGHKLDALASCDIACFTVVGSDDVLPEEFTTAFRSAMVFGRASIVSDEDEKRRSLEALGRKYMAPGDEAGLEREIAGGYARLHMVRIDPVRITGKQAIELVRDERAGA